MESSLIVFRFANGITRSLTHTPNKMWGYRPSIVIFVHPVLFFFFPSHYAVAIIALRSFCTSLRPTTSLTDELSWPTRAISPKSSCVKHATRATSWELSTFLFRRLSMRSSSCWMQNPAWWRLPSTASNLRVNLWGFSSSRSNASLESESSNQPRVAETTQKWICLWHD